MSWREQLRPASFRGVAFFVDTSERSGGRRIVKHEYPKRDDPFAEDLGRKPRTFTVEGYVLGSDYFAARDALIDALEGAGDGELVHPYFGLRRVVVDGEFRVRESADHGGVAHFTIPFFETPAKAVQPTPSKVAAASLVQASAVSAQSAATAAFLAKYSPGVLLDSAANLLRSVALKINNVISTITSDQQELATMEDRVALLKSSALALANEPSSILDSLLGIFGLASDRRGLLAVYSFNPGPRPPGTISSRLQEQGNFDALQRLVQQLALIQAVSVTPDETFDSYDAAIAARESLTDLLDEQAEIVADDTYPALLQLRADLVKAVPGEDSDLPRLARVNLPFAVPSLVLAHRLYGDVSKEADLLARNRVKDPGFVSGELEILSDG